MQICNAASQHCSSSHCNSDNIFILNQAFQGRKQKKTKNGEKRMCSPMRYAYVPNVIISVYCCCISTTMLTCNIYCGLWKQITDSDGVMYPSTDTTDMKWSPLRQVSPQNCQLFIKTSAIDCILLVFVWCHISKILLVVRHWR